MNVINVLSRNIILYKNYVINDTDQKNDNVITAP